MPPVPSRSKRGASAEEDKPSWNGTTDEPESPKPKPKRRDPTQGTYKAGMSCYNCRKAKRKCDRPVPSADCQYCTDRGMLCVQPERTFQGYRADLPEKATTNPSMQHREQVCSTLLGSEGTASPAGYLRRKNDL